MDATTQGQLLALMQRDEGWRKRCTYNRADAPTFKSKYGHTIPLVGVDRALLLDILRTGSPADVAELVRLAKA